MGGGVPDAGGLLDPDGAVAHLVEWKGRVDELAANTRAMNERLQELRVTAADGNGLVEVTVDSTGALAGLRLGQRIQRVAPDVVAEAIMATVHAARRTLADQAEEIVNETLGIDSAAARAISEQVAQRWRDEGPGDSAPDRQRHGW